MTGKKRRPNLNFKEMGIPKGSLLLGSSGETAIVNSERTVIFRNEEVSLTQATITILGKYNNPCRHWTYNGKRLTEIYDAVF